MQETQSRRGGARHRKGVPRELIVIGVLVAIVAVVALVALVSGGDDPATEVVGLEGVRYDTDSTFIVAAVQYRGDSPQDIDCIARGPQDTALRSAGATPLDVGRGEWVIPVQDKPEGTYTVSCGDRDTIGDSPGAFQQTVEVKRDPSKTVVRGIGGLYEIPTYSVAINQPPTRVEPRQLVVVFNFFEDGTMLRVGPQVVALRFRPQPDGSYRAEETPATDLTVVHSVRFEGENADTTIEYRWRGGGTFPVRDVWRKIGAIPAGSPVASATLGPGRQP